MDSETKFCKIIIFSFFAVLLLAIGVMGGAFLTVGSCFLSLIVVPIFALIFNFEITESLVNCIMWCCIYGSFGIAILMSIATIILFISEEISSKTKSYNEPYLFKKYKASKTTFKINTKE